MIDPGNNDSIHRFDHDAMNTRFSLFIPGIRHDRAIRAAGACFRLLDRLEECLSRFRDDSDVSRVNALQRGETVFIDEETYACLKLAIEASASTGGLFDATLGAQIEHRKQNEPAAAPEITGRIELAPDRPLVSCTEPGRQIDLGGIGKGFGLDRMAQTFRAQDIDSALLSCAGSTLLAIGDEGWSVVLQGDDCERNLTLRDEALSASGSGFQGSHVVHPERPNYRYHFRRVWIVAGSAAMADAFSTACLLMTETELEEFLTICPLVKRCFIEPVLSGEILEKQV